MAEVTARHPLAGMRRTRQRERVLDALDQHEAFVSAQDLHASMIKAGSDVALATVYRTLSALVDAGEADVLTEGSESLYRRCDDRSHHHHLVCRSCGTAVEVSDDAIERWARKTARRHGFDEIEHRIEVFGICRVCRGRP